MSKPPVLLQPDQIKPPGFTSIYSLQPDKLRREGTYKPSLPQDASVPKPHTHVFHDQSVYDGHSLDGLFQGPGTLTLSEPNPASYAGSWSSGLREGQGTLKLLLHDGHSAQVSGTWDCGQLVADSAVYEIDHFSLSSAKFSDSGQLIHGRLVFPSGSWYEGDFLDGMKHGQGTWHGSDGSSYTGEYKQDLRHGYGVFTRPNEPNYAGNWTQDALTDCS
ncbi:MORN repeat-containing protein 1-like [Schistocerca gregaria]|uniref:MORN repeat-containing protein 1-like n=1 Tax=Schistocerca gregaria TaxID=7010 RepID=UPI00211E1738|nr:MORN repeat-containing protein 1-like [Schistocerca gregaria]